MVVVLAHGHDRGAAAVVETVAADRGMPNVVVVRPEILGLCSWSHSVDRAGGASTQLTLPSGVIVASDRVECLVNRLEYLPMPRFLRASEKNKDYAAVEIQALATSWLAALGRRVINPIGDVGWTVRGETPRHWLGAATACGLPVMRSVAATAGRLLGPLGAGERACVCAPWPGGAAGPMPVDVVVDQTRVEPAGAVLVTGSDATGSLAGIYGHACCALAGYLNYALVECGFSVVAGRMVLTSVDPRPPLTTTSDVAAVCSLVARVARESRAPA